MHSMISPKVPLLACASVFLGTSLFAQTNVITFETLPDGTRLAGGTVIANQFLASHGVRFQFEDGSYPVIRLVGGSINGRPTAFHGWPNGRGDNTPAPGQDIGTRFLTDDNQVGVPPAPLLVSYAQPVSAASGFILDIDGEESWDLEARTSSNSVVGRIHLQSGTPLTGDGIATPWTFQRPTADIRTIRIVYSGTTNANVGLAFDNFSPAVGLPNPAPARLELTVTNGSAGLTVFGTRAAVYSIEESSGIQGAEWTPLTSLVLDSTTTFTVTNLLATNTPGRFFRALGVR